MSKEQKIKQSQYSPKGKCWHKLMYFSSIPSYTSRTQVVKITQQMSGDIWMFSLLQLSFYKVKTMSLLIKEREREKRKPLTTTTIRKYTKKVITVIRNCETTSGQALSFFYIFQ